MLRRIAFLGSLLGPGGSGVERAVRELHRAYSEAPGTEVSTVKPPRALAGFRLARIFWEQFVLPLALRRDRPDLLVAPAYVAPLMSPVPFVLYVYDLHVFTHPETCTLANRLHYRLLMPASIRRAAAVVAPSERVRQAIAARFPECEAKIAVVPLGVDRAVFRPAEGDAEFPGRAAALRERLGLPERFALFVGNMAPRKNLALLADGGALPLPLVAVGRGTEAEKTARRLFIGLGRVPDAELADLYRMAFALVHPAIDEGFGLTLLEAMACGCPVVSSPNVAAELLSGVAATAVSSEEFADALGRLASDPAFRARSVRRGIELAASFKWRAVQ